jgi:hypothetical protein
MTKQWRQQRRYDRRWRLLRDERRQDGRRRWGGKDRRQERRRCWHERDRWDGHAGDVGRLRHERDRREEQALLAAQLRPDGELTGVEDAGTAVAKVFIRAGDGT